MILLARLLVARMVRVSLIGCSVGRESERAREHERWSIATLVSINATYATYPTISLSLSLSLSRL